MAAVLPEATGPKALGVRWDLSPIVSNAAACRALLDATLHDCQAFADRYRGTVATVDPAGLASALAWLGRIENALYRVNSYAGLRRAVDVNDDEARDLEAVVDQGLVQAGNLLRFFELEWIALDDETAERLAGADEVARDRHHLEAARRYKPHRLAEQAEQMLAEREPAASMAWQNLFAQVVANVKAPLDAGDGERDHNVDELLAYVYVPDRDLRRRALETLYTALEPHTPVLAHCYDSLVADRLVDDRLRSYPDPLAARHLANELPPEAVEAMMTAVEGRYGIAQRWFRRKAELLGLDTLALYDQYAPLDEGREVSYAEASRLVRDGFTRFSPRIAAVADGFHADRRIDAEPRQGKRGGAFCASVAQDSRPFVMLNYTDRLRDVMTMAHEFGHGMHFQFSAERQTPHSMHPGIAMAEVPSTFAELIVVDYLLESEQDPATRSALVRGELESGFATVFRQVAMARYEQDAYALRAAGQALTPERLSEIWLRQNERYYADAMLLPDGYRFGWSYIPHFINTRFYTYAYAFAHLASLVLYALYRERGASFVDDYLEFLGIGGAASPADQLGAFGVDLTDPATWERGLDEIERLLELALV